MKFKILCLTTALSVTFITQAFASFSDISSNSWYYEYVSTLSEKNIINGYTDGTFRAENNITNGEVLKIVLTAIGETPSSTSDGSHWALGYLNKAYQKGYITSDKVDLDVYANRLFICEIIFNALNVNTININSPFVDIDDDMINTLYELSIVKGVETNGILYLYGDKNVKRSEVSALVVRMMDILDKNISKKSYSHPNIKTVRTPTTIEEFKNIYLQMAIIDQSERLLEYADIGFYQMQSDYNYLEYAKIAFNEVFEEYPEYFTFANQASTPMSGSLVESDITIKLSSSYYNNSTITNMKKDFFSEVEDIWHILRLNETLTSSMTEYNRAKAIFEWIVKNNEYDLTQQSVSYTGYGLVFNNKGVCQSYVALFNALCKMEGISVYGMSGMVDNIEHIWSVAILDGKKCYIDPTFADPVPNKDGYCDFSYFDISESDLRVTHIF